MDNQTVKNSTVSTAVEYILLFLSGFAALSLFSNVLLNRLGFYLIEIPLIPIFLFYFAKKEIRIGDKKLRFTTMEFANLFLIVASIAMGIVSTGAAFSVVTCIRPYVYILIILKYIKDYDMELSCHKLYVMSLGCVLGDYIYSQYYSVYLITKGYQHINIMALALIVIIPMIRKKKVLAIFSIILGIFMAILSGYRINILVLFIAILSCLIINLLSSKSLVSNLIYFVLFVVIILAVNWSVDNFDRVTKFLTNIFRINQYVVARTFGRIQGLLNNELTLGDERRLNMFAYPVTRFLDKLLMQGPVGKNSASYFGIYTDAPIVFFYDVYGSPIAWGVLLFLAGMFIKRARAVVRGIRERTASEYAVLFLALLPVMLTLIIINGTFLTFVNISVLFALAFGGYNNIYTTPNHVYGRLRGDE